MMKREWALKKEPASNADLRKAPPTGLGKNNGQVRALEVPVEAVDFADVDADVAGSNLNAADTVAELRDVIWFAIPKANRSQ